MRRVTVQHDETSYERLLFFSDAVFAIAITLLVLDLRPADAIRGGEIDWAPLIPKLAGFALSFYVVGRYWMQHHQLFVGVRGYDRRLVNLNLVLLAAVAFVPFPTSVVIEATAAAGPVMFYCGSLAALGLLWTVLVVTARRPALLKPGETTGGTAHAAVSAAGAPAIFLLAFAIAAFDARAALWSLLLLIPSGEVAERLGRWAEKRIDAAREDGAPTATLALDSAETPEEAEPAGDQVGDSSEEDGRP